jgi:hypothetical protein
MVYTNQIPRWGSRCPTKTKLGDAQLIYEPTRLFRTEVHGHTSRALPAGIEPTTQRVVGWCSTNSTNDPSKTGWLSLSRTSPRDGFLEDVLVESSERVEELCPKFVRAYGIEFLEIRCLKLLDEKWQVLGRNIC